MAKWQRLPNKGLVPRSGRFLPFVFSIFNPRLLILGVATRTMYTQYHNHPRDTSSYHLRSCQTIRHSSQESKEYTLSLVDGVRLPSSEGLFLPLVQLSLYQTLFTNIQGIHLSSTAHAVIGLLGTVTII